MTEMKTYKYYYSLLDPALREVCDNIVQGLWRFEADIIVYRQVSDSDLCRVLRIIDLDYPEIFWVDSKLYPVHFSRCGKAVCVRYRYLYTAAEAGLIRGKLFDKARSIMKSIPNGTPLHKRISNINSWLSRNVSYSYGSIGHDQLTVTGALLNGAAICEGFAKSFKYLCDLCGINTLIVHGTAENNINGEERHCWNIVNSGSSFSHYDVTYNSNSYHMGFSDSLYSDMSDEQISINHNWERTSVPECSGASKGVRLCTSGSELSALICKEAALNDQRIIFESNKRFEEETVTEMVALIINKHPELNVLSFAVNYNPSNRRALIALKKSL